MFVKFKQRKNIRKTKKLTKKQSKNIFFARKIIIFQDRHKKTFKLNLFK